MGLNINKIVPVYQYWISELIEKMGKPITLVRNIPPEGEDEKLSDWQREDNTQVEQQTLKALLEYNPRDYRKYTGEIQQPQGILQVKTYLRHAPALQQCDWIVPSIDSKQYISTRYKLTRDIIPVGLGEDAFLVSYWERI